MNVLARWYDWIMIGDRPDLADPVDLDAVDDDRDVDSDAATAELLPVDPPRPRPSGPAATGVVRSGVVPAVVTGAVAGSAAAASARVMHKHPKLTLGAAILGAIIAVTPAEKRPQLLKRIGLVAALLVGLFVLLIGVVALIGVNASDGRDVSPAPTSVPTTSATCDRILC
jgi:hypothetical protein